MVVFSVIAVFPVMSDCSVKELRHTESTTVSDTMHTYLIRKGGGRGVGGGWAGASAGVFLCALRIKPKLSVTSLEAIYLFRSSNGRQIRSHTRSVSPIAVPAMLCRSTSSAAAPFSEILGTRIVLRHAWSSMDTLDWRKIFLPIFAMFQLQLLFFLQQNKAWTTGAREPWPWRRSTLQRTKEEYKWKAWAVVVPAFSHFCNSCK